MTRLIDADALKEVANTTVMSKEQRNMFIALIDRQPSTGCDEHEVDRMTKEIDYWRKHCHVLESTIIKLAIKYMEREGI